MKKISFLFTYVLLSLTATAQDAPLWVSDRTARFPDSRFVSALGNGQSVREAETDAASQIAFYFSAHVQAKNETNLDVTDGGQKRRTAQSGVSVSSDTELPQLQFTSPWQNKHTGEYLVCAYIERSAAADFCRTRLEQKLSAVQTILDSTKGSSVSLADIQPLSEAKKNLSEADVLLENVIALSQKPQKTLAERIAALRRNTDTLLAGAKRNATVSVSIQGDDDGTLKTVLEEIAESQEAVVSERGRYRISGRLTMTFSENEVGFFARPGISLRVIDSSTQETVYTFVRQYQKWGHKSKDAAKTKAVVEVEKDLRKNFRPAGE